MLVLHVIFSIGFVEFQNEFKKIAGRPNVQGAWEAIITEKKGFFSTYKKETVL